MKKILLLLIALTLSLTVLASCEALDFIANVFGDDNQTNEGAGYLYTSFTATEKKLLTDVAGGVVPFAKNNEYYVEEYVDESTGKVGVNYYTYGNTKAEFDAYYALFSDYELIETYKDEFGDTWHCLEGDTYVEISYYYYDGENVIDVYVYPISEDGGNEDSGSGDTGNSDTGSGNTGSGDSGSGDTGSGDSGNQGGNDEYKYTDFTASEKALFTQIAGAVIPFAKTNEYYVEEYYDEYYEENCVNYYTYGNTKSEFDAYYALFSNYELVETFEDEYGDTWYCLEGDTYVEMSYYSYEGDTVIDVFVYVKSSDSGSGSDGGNTGGGDSGNSGSGSSSSTNEDLITNAGAGLPAGTNGVYDVDFTDATYVKDVTDQGYYVDGCPTVGSPKVLVIPVDFNDINGRSNGYSIDKIKRAFIGGTGATDYYSVHDYYYISSYGKLDLDITVIDEWFVPENNSSYYANATTEYYGDEVAIGDQLVMDEALKYLSTVMDLSEFDSDNNDIIDAVVLITTLEIDPDTDFYWAYRYWNIYTDENDYYYEYDGVSANDYMWAPYSFMHESYDEDGYADYTDTSIMNTYTYIHEFGHVLGADDYYNTADQGEHPMNSCDIMDGMTGDHNAYTKFNFGWLTTSRLVTTSSSVTLTLDAFAKTGDTIIIANNWDSKLGAYQEYYVVVYYTAEKLNADGGGYFVRDGVVVYHVNASLYSEDYDGETYYDVYNNNTDPSDEYGTEDNLIEFVKSSAGNLTYVAGDTIPAVKDDQGNTLGYTFTVDSIEDGQATITFTKR